MLSILWDALHFDSKELPAFRESSVARKWRKHATGEIMYQICYVLHIKAMTEGYDDRSPQTIPLKLPQHLQQLSL